MSCHEKNDDGGGGEKKKKKKIEEEVSPIEMVKQLKFTNYSFLLLFIIFTADSDSK